MEKYLYRLSSAVMVILCAISGFMLGDSYKDLVTHVIGVAGFQGIMVAATAHLLFLVKYERGERNVIFHVSFEPSYVVPALASGIAMAMLSVFAPLSLTMLITAIPFALWVTILLPWGIHGISLMSEWRQYIVRVPGYGSPQLKRLLRLAWWS